MRRLFMLELLAAHRWRITAFRLIRPTSLRSVFNARRMDEKSPDQIIGRGFLI